MNNTVYNTQQTIILAHLKKNKWFWVPVSYFLQIWIKQYQQRIYELRKQGYLIINKVESEWEKRYSFYKLTYHKDPDFTFEEKLSSRDLKYIKKIDYPYNTWTEAEIKYNKRKNEKA